MRDALSVAAEALDARNRGQWRRVAELTDPDDVRVWYQQWLSIPDSPPRELTPEEIRRHEPDMPDEVARYHAERVNRRAAESAGSLHGRFAGVDTREGLAQLEPAEGLARYLQARDSDPPFAERLNTRRTERWPSTGQSGPACVRDAVGVVHEGRDRAHVVYRVRWPAGERESESRSDEGVAVATFRRTSAGWRLRLGGELFEHRDRVVITEAREEESEQEGSATPRHRTDDA